MRLPLRAAVLAVAVLVAGCSQDVSGSGKSKQGTTFPSDIQDLAGLLSRGNESIKTAHLDLTETAAGQTVKGSGDEKLSGGKATSIDLSETVNSISLEFIIIDTQVYAKLPPTVYQSSKPWVQITSSTSDPTLQQLYQSFQSSLQSGAGNNVSALVSAGKNLDYQGTEQLDGATVGSYLITVDVSSLPTDFPNRDALVQSGLSSIPVHLYVDQQGRARKVTEHLSVSGQTVDVLVTLTKFDAPVDISPPPADQVAHP
jgi:hypothetical protein